jgi:hypothetical protein
MNNNLYEKCINSIIDMLIEKISAKIPYIAVDYNKIKD